MNFDKYIIKKGKTDLRSSLEALDKKLLHKKMKEFGVDSLKEMCEYIIDFFEVCLDMSKDDYFTRMYFKKIIDNENTMFMSAYQEDIESLWVFVYENKDHLSYYIADEIKKIIKKKLNI